MMILLPRAWSVEHGAWKEKNSLPLSLCPLLLTPEVLK